MRLWLASLMALVPRPGGAEQTATAPPGVGADARPVVERGALAKGWTDLGWAQHTFSAGKPVKVDFSAFAGWILSHAELKPEFGGLLISYRAPDSFADFLEVALDSRTHPTFPRVRLRAEASARAPDGWISHWIPMTALDPLALPFDRLTLRAVRPVGLELVEIDTIGFTDKAPPMASERALAKVPPRTARVMLDCSRARPISPLIYGVSFGDEITVAELGATAVRWGGNPTSRYNWKLGNAWNVGKDWFFRNVAMNDPPWDAFLTRARAHGLATAFTLPMIGWVAKDTTSCGFPASLDSEQKRFDPDTHACGNGVGANGAPTPSSVPSISSVPAPPGFVAEWVQAIRAKDPPPRSVRLYYLDNEPTLWPVTHRDVHPNQLTYDEFLERTISYATAARVADPEARIAGLVAWGWPALFDAVAEKSGAQVIPVDRLEHGGRALVPWWLSKLRAHGEKAGGRLVDLVDVHFYPQAPGVGLYTDGWTDPESCARRIRSVRALWDPTYKDESWIGDTMKLLPRLRAWIDEEYPGLGISIGEYNFGAEGHISGGLAVAEALGRFGTNGVDAAFYWAMPPKGSAAYWAFRAFRNYDGQGGKVGDTAVAASSNDSGLSSMFATRKADGSLVLVALNHEPDKPLNLFVEPGSCGALRVGRHFGYAGKEGLRPAPLEAGARAGQGIRLPPWSINVLELRPSP